MTLASDNAHYFDVRARRLRCWATSCLGSCQLNSDSDVTERHMTRRWRTLDFPRAGRFVVPGGSRDSNSDALTPQAVMLRLRRCTT